MIAEALVCLALNIYHEARGEGVAEQLAVAQVVMNRVASEHFPSTVCNVVREGGERRLYRCQFSWWCDGQSDRPRDRQAWTVALVLADVVLGGAVDDQTNGALFYHAYAVHPSWARVMVPVRWDGAHIFYTYEGGR